MQKISLILFKLNHNCLFFKHQSFLIAFFHSLPYYPCWSGSGWKCKFIIISWHLSALLCSCDYCYINELSITHHSTYQTTTLHCHSTCLFALSSPHSSYFLYFLFFSIEKRLNAKSSYNLSWKGGKERWNFCIGSFY